MILLSWTTLKSTLVRFHIVQNFVFQVPVSGNGYSNTLKIVAKTEQDPLSFFRSEDMSLCQIFVQVLSPER